ncbi:MAG: M23 family metallopeptidase [Pseudomonadota bacterium]
MSRKSGKAKRFIARFFKERQIYHRSDGVVHFISMSTRTQIALAAVCGAALLWIAYASVNVVFKEQIIVAKERDARVMETTYVNRLQNAHTAYNDVNELNVLMRSAFDESMAEIANRHQTLKSMVDRKVAIDTAVESLTERLSEAGFPDGQKPKSGNRVMIDATPAEPTPRQSRISKMLREAEREALLGSAKVPAGSPAETALKRMAKASANLYVEQVLLLAAMEEKASQKINELETVIASTGINTKRIIPQDKIKNTVMAAANGGETLAQGGPFIDPANLTDADTIFFTHANRVGSTIETLARLQSIVDNVPLSSPLIGPRRFTSGFGIRRDPINGRSASHHGIDFAARWASPVTATAKGTVRFAGVKSGWGRLVEIDHGNGFVTRYAHLNRFVVKKGQTVKLHQQVGELGNSGRSTGPHVHYEILFNGRPVNPQRFIEAGRYVFEG